MKKNIILTLMILASCKSADVKKLDYYEVSYKKYIVIDDKAFEEQYKGANRDQKMLNKKNLTKTEYYTLWFKGNESLYRRVPSLNDNEKLDGNESSISYSVAKTDLYRNLSSSKTLLNIEGEEKLIQDSLKNLEWVLLPSKEQKMLGYKVRKATAKGLEKNSTITAWYTPEIKSEQGPFVYWGLPGLILKIETSYGSNSGLLGIIKASVTEAFEIKKVLINNIKIDSSGRKVQTKEEWKKEVEQRNKKLNEFNNQGVDTSD